MRKAVSFIVFIILSFILTGSKALAQLFAYISNVGSANESVIDAATTPVTAVAAKNKALLR
jgi:hypothetical protein